MSSVPLGRAVRAVAYYTLSNAAWDRRAGLHELDFGLDIVVDGCCWGLIWGRRTGTLQVMTHSLVGEAPGAESIDMSSSSPWSDVIDSPLVDVGVDGECVLRLVPQASGPIWVVAGNYLDDLDQVLVGGDSVLVIYDEGLARSTGLG